jgi:hypothetical protein
MAQFDVHPLSDGMLVAVPAGELRSPVASLAQACDELKRGLDILIDGF